jgi:hypothetical protein
MLALNLGDPGDGILVSSPIYGRFELDFGNEARLKIVYANMKGVDSLDEAVVGRFEQAMKDAKTKGIRIRALLISNPSNPLGTSSRSRSVELALIFLQDSAIPEKLLERSLRFVTNTKCTSSATRYMPCRSMILVIPKQSLSPPFSQSTSQI